MAWGAPSPLIAVVGMTSEARIVAAEGVRVIIGGGDTAALEQRLGQAIDAHLAGDERPSVISLGVCGALSPALKPGDLVIGAGVICAGQRFPTDAAWAERLAADLPFAVKGDVAGGDAVLASAADKAALFAATGALVVDMESHAAARLAQRHALPFAVLRAVSDTADHSLPPAALAGFRQDGGIDLAAVLGSLARQPGQIGALLRTARQAGPAFSALKAARRTLS